MSEVEVLRQENSNLQAENARLQAQLKAIFQMLNGKKSEKLSQPDPAQLELFETDSTNTVVAEKERVSYTRTKKTDRSTHPGRNALPQGLPVEIEVIEPENKAEDMVRIGEEVTETLEHSPARLYIHRIVRPKYAHKPQNQQEGQANVVIADLPQRPIPNGKVGVSLLAYLMVAKFVDHLPFYRINKQFERDFEVSIAASTMSDWFKQTCQLLEPLHDRLKQKLLQSGYLQVDESPLKVLDADKPKSTHQGYCWVYHDPVDKTILFDYQKGRGKNGPKQLLSNFKGYIQCDGYVVYDKLSSQTPGIRLAGCLVHARRYFHQAKDNDSERANYVLKLFAQVYKLEKEAKQLDLESKQAVRLEKMKPIYLQLKQWCMDQLPNLLPKSSIAKAISYYLKQYPKLIAVFEDPMLELDNNLVENKIRPLALGRKNYLFAGSHPAAKRLAMMYTFIASCKANNVNPSAYLKSVLTKLPSTAINNLDHLLPNQYANYHLDK
jgi:transposase